MADKQMTKASMGPRRIAADDDASEGITSVDVELQWGRGVSPRMTYPHYCKQCALDSFNGAAAYRRG